MGHGSPLVLHHGSAISGRERNLIVGYEMDLQEEVAINKEVTGLAGGSDAIAGDACPTVIRDLIHGLGAWFRGTDVLYFTQTGDTKTAGTIALTCRHQNTGVGTHYLFYAVTGATNYRIYTSGGASVMTTNFGNAGAQAANFIPTSMKSFRVVVTWGNSHVYVFVDSVLTDDYDSVFADDIATGFLGANTAPGANGLVGSEHEFIMERRQWAAEDVKRDYIQFARRAHYQESFRSAHVSSAGTAAGRLENTHWTVVNAGATDFRVAHDLASERIFGIKNAKHVSCVADGRLWIPSQSLGLKAADPEAAYGTWEFWFYKALASTPSIYLVSSTSDPATTSGYKIEIFNNERLLLRRVTAGVDLNVMRTIENFFPTETWTKIAVARRYDGRFTIYINNRIIAAADIDLGSDPVTDNAHALSSFLIANLDAGDRMGPITHRWGECL